MIAIVDYGVGNLFSLRSSFDYIGEKAVVTGEQDIIHQADRILLPGVGAFGDASAKLHASGLDCFLKKEAASGKPFLGICLGMQLLFDYGFEYGTHKGLSLIPGNVVSIPNPDNKLKIPHMGWNSLSFPKDKPKSRLFEQVSQGEFVYFVHSYYATNCEKSVSATTEYGIMLTAAAESGNVFGTQFHPEKSGETGLNILRTFAKL